VSRQPQQIVPEQTSEIIENFSIAGRMKSMTSIVHMDPGQLKTAGHPTDPIGSFKDRNMGQVFTSELIGRPESGGSGSQDDDMGLFGQLRFSPRADNSRFALLKAGPRSGFD
jgi:hypothetical protein